MYPYIWAADAGDLVSAAWLNTVAHPPGFPLYTLFLKLFFLLPFGSIALRASLVSLVFALGTIYLTYRLTYATLTRIYSPNRKLVTIATFSCSGFSAYWVFFTTIFLLCHWASMWFFFGKNEKWYCNLLRSMLLCSVALSF
ncbi:hypothetical protein COU89_01170 [Candidatus Roizmanbacteria bacterium CG10_big_fil_rev_8_21_14_0_10_45_7]|uniref:DUF2723 domain-containing protein n=1 Tax=Candidatus Roizmanbacteria bacterium CG10_big_fil_rev_8_21_14_0_10_45_7 TaxID=1974854 RepID=A0A2M8KVA7_9BACT|nr:MAG: hypothetical protein COU89_01170 [Candidatus Roizmanbacteria bacterium CG10_big_fil_rev_8_21_14_0_10_45_7]